MSATTNITAKALRNAALLLLFPGSLVIAQTPAWSTGNYAYDGAGNISQIGADQYSYDSVGRLVKGTAGPGHDQSYSYDPFGNITKVVTDGNAGTAMIPSMDPAKKNRLASTLATGTTVRGAYDAAGNLIDYQGSLSTYRYDGLNMLKEIQAGGHHELYVYTADNERIAAIALGGTSVLSYRWTIRGLDQKVLRQFDQTVTVGGDVWSWKEDYVYANGQLLAAETSTSDHTLHFFTDHLGTPRLITNSDGVVISRHTYYPFGEEATSAAQDSERLKFTGHERDATLDYMHARFTNASLGRFLSVDPVLDVDRAMHNPQGWNRYAYVENNPIRHTDPTGKVVGIDDLIEVSAVLYVLASNPQIVEEAVNSILTLGGVVTTLSEAQNNRPETNTGARQDAKPTREDIHSDVTQPYKRPSNATTPEQRKSVQNQPCGDCGKGGKMNADHKDPLVKQYYKEGKLDMSKVRDVKSVRSQCPTCSAQQGGRFSQWSKVVKDLLGF